MRQKRASPLYSPFGCGTTIVLVLVLGAILRFRGGGPFSPGSLSAASSQGEQLSGFASHADFEEECALCHAGWRGATADRCESCHTGIVEQRNSSLGLHGRLPETGDCHYCHTDHKGQEADITHYDLASFEHEWLTDFSLAKHELNFDAAPIACENCHLKQEFQSGAIACVECHLAAEPLFTEDHSSQFGEDCQACHDGRDTMVGFDHQAIFALEGAHTSLECAACHTPTILAGTPNECAGCHEEPAVHAGQFGLDCARCHTATAWLPARLSYHTFPLDHGGEGKIDCQTCHTQVYTGYTCTNCHAHEPAEVRSSHLEEGISEFEDCIDCHPTGLEDEAEKTDNV